MDDIMQDFQQVFEVAERTARKYFKNNQDIFKANNYDVDDLIQEAKTRAFRTIEKYTSGQNNIAKIEGLDRIEKIFKNCNKAIGWKLKEKLRACRKRYFKMQEYRMNNQTLPVEFLSYDENNPESLLPTRELSDESIDQANRINSLGFRFEQLASVLSEDEYDIMTEIIKNGSTLERLSERYDCSISQIKKQYDHSLLKIKKYLCI